GLDRYITFVPRDMKTTVPARVLDLHRQRQPSGFKILVEWITDSPQGAVRTRHIRMLNSKEVESIQEMTEQQKREVAGAFNDSLSPNEPKTRRLARQLGLHTFGYTDFRRGPGTEGDGLDPQRSMSSIVHLGVRGMLQDRFHDNLNDLLTEEERKHPNYNIHD